MKNNRGFVECHLGRKKQKMDENRSWKCFVHRSLHYYENRNKKFICCNLSHQKLFRISSLSPSKFPFNSFQLQIYFDYALRYIDNSKLNSFVHRVSEYGKHSFYIALFWQDTRKKRQNFLFQYGMAYKYLYF